MFVASFNSLILASAGLLLVLDPHDDTSTINVFHMYIFFLFLPIIALVLLIVSLTLCVLFFLWLRQRKITASEASYVLKQARRRLERRRAQGTEGSKHLDVLKQARRRLERRLEEMDI